MPQSSKKQRYNAAFNFESRTRLFLHVRSLGFTDDCSTQLVRDATRNRLLVRKVERPPAKSDVPPGIYEQPNDARIAYMLQALHMYGPSYHTHCSEFHDVPIRLTDESSDDDSPPVPASDTTYQWARETYWKYYNGGTLADWFGFEDDLAGFKPPYAVVARFIRQVYTTLRFMQHAHQNTSIHHYNLKPKNIFLHWRDENDFFDAPKDEVADECADIPDCYIGGLEWANDGWPFEVEGEDDHTSAVTDDFSAMLRMINALLGLMPGGERNKRHKRLVEIYDLAEEMIPLGLPRFMNLENEYRDGTDDPVPADMLREHWEATGEVIELAAKLEQECLSDGPLDERGEAYFKNFVAEGKRFASDNSAVENPALFVEADSLEEAEASAEMQDIVGPFKLSKGKLLCQGSKILGQVWLYLDEEEEESGDDGEEEEEVDYGEEQVEEGSGGDDDSEEAELAESYEDMGRMAAAAGEMARRTGEVASGLAGRAGKTTAKATRQAEKVAARYVLDVEQIAERAAAQAEKWAAQAEEMVREAQEMTGFLLDDSDEAEMIKDYVEMARDAHEGEEDESDLSETELPSSDDSSGDEGRMPTGKDRGVGAVEDSDSSLEISSVVSSSVVSSVLSDSDSDSDHSDESPVKRPRVIWPGDEVGGSKSKRQKR
ncbi:hypothetical protein QBC47DRAFT_416327 [Echria macrotheca]|uniref:Protein kinase domain-containing protein n=1 Tax=Echria macrotheca TaxID=438768 RepID=A0AAJ0F919_9PEZI|nr:hypothetical protein QBC47DRAFT_416327 [Echria macrotheca]